MFSFLTLQKDNSLSGSFGIISWNLLDTKTVKGFGSEKGIRSAVVFLVLFFIIKSFFRNCISSLVSSNTNMSRNPQNGSVLILCNSSCICISRGWSVFNFPSACKADSESEKNHEFPLLILVGLFKGKQNCLQLRCVNWTVVSQSTQEGAIWGNRRHCCSSNLLIHFWAVGKYLHIILMFRCNFKKKACLHTSGFVVSFFFFFVKDRQIWGSDWLQGGVFDTLVSSTTSRSIFESSNSGRIQRPRGGVRLGFSKSFDFDGSKTQL